MLYVPGRHQTPAPRTFALVGSVSGCALYRVWQPFEALRRRGVVAEWDFMGLDHNSERAQLGLPPVAQDFSEACFAQCFTGLFDVVVLPRLGWRPDEVLRDVVGRPLGTALERGLRLIERLHAAGVALVYEADDDIFSHWIVDQQRRGLVPDRTEAQLDVDRQGRIAVLQACDGVTVTGARLATVVRQFVPDGFPVLTVPNRIDWQRWRRVRQALPWAPHPPTIGWVGGGRPDDDLVAMAVAWGRIARRYPAVRFVVGGCRTDASGAASLAETPWVAPVLAEVPADRIEARAWLPPNDYERGYLGIDVGCAPLASRAFNRCKSPIKLYEYAAAGAAVVASPTVYGAVLGDGDGLLCTTADEWEGALAALLDDDELRRAMAQQWRRRVAMEFALESGVGEWAAAWATIRDGRRSAPSVTRLARVS